MFSRPVIWNGIPTHASAHSAWEASDPLVNRYGRNIGNMAFVAAIETIISGIKRRNQQPADYPDVGVIASANQLNPHNAQKTENLPPTPYPLVSIGLGAQADSLDDLIDLPPSIAEWVADIQSRSPTEHPNIALRGEYSYKVLVRAGLHHKAVPLGCPSNLIAPLRELGAVIREKSTRPLKRVGVVAGNLPKLTDELASIERMLVQVVNKSRCGYVVQSPAPVIQMIRDRFIDSDVRLADRIRKALTPNLSTSEFQDWLVEHGLYFFDVGSWMEYTRRLDVVIGTRIHGCMLALQAGTPAVCITIDSRTEELCSFMQIPSLSSRAAVQGSLEEQAKIILLNHDWSAYDRNRLDLARKYAGFLQNNGLSPSLHLRSLC